MQLSLLNRILQDRSLPTCPHSTVRLACAALGVSILQIFIIMMHEFNNPCHFCIIEELVWKRLRTEFLES